ncbi:hypothetical protein LTS08_001822 [Lithohypha guttulata]|nr:hypothetical protein LTS08_001822 [Lithohypha guttulata]
MAVHGQRFNLDLDADNWQFDLREHEQDSTSTSVIKEIYERDTNNVPAAPTLRSTKSGFPERRPKKVQSAFKKQNARKATDSTIAHPGPSDRAILNHVAQKQGVDLATARTKADIDAENRDRINHMSLEEIEDARSELMAQINPEALKKFLQRANVDDENQQQQKDWEDHEAGRPQDSSKKNVTFAEPKEELLEEDHQQVAVEEHINPDKVAETAQLEHGHIPDPIPNPPSVHFPAPPRRKEDYKPLDPSSDTFLKDLREHYFPDLPHDPNALSWLQDPSPEEDKNSSYNPERTGFVPSAIRFDFSGKLIPPSQSLDIPTTKGLHHHGEAPSSAGYTVPELALLARSTLSSQRAVAYQVMGRILYRLGRGDFGARGSDLNEGLWTCIERERIVEVMMVEANRDKGHLSAKAYATEALWLWRRGGGGDRGVLKEGERRAL